MKNKNSVLMPKDKRIDERKRDIAFRILTVIGVSFLLGIIIRLSKIDDFSKAGDFFTGEIWIQILVLSALIATVLSTLYFYSIYVRRDLRKDKKLLPVLSASIILTFVLSLIFSIFINVYIAPLVLASLLVATLLDKRIGLVTTVLTSQAFFITYIIVFGAEEVVDTAAAMITSMIAAIFLVCNMDRSGSRFKFTGIAIIVGVCTALIPVLLNLIIDSSNVINMLMSGLWSLLSVVLSVALYMCTHQTDR